MNNYMARNFMFPAIFALRRERVFRALEYLETSQWLSSVEIQELQLEKLKSIVNHAYSAVPFYRRIFDERKLKPGDIKSLEDVSLLPLLEKQDLRELAATVQLPRKKLRSYSIRRSAGTSGIPVIIFVDNEANAQSLAMRYRTQGWFNVRIGDRQARFWGRPISSEKTMNVVKDHLLNRMRIVPTDLQQERIELIFNRVKRFDPAFFYGYPSMILRFGDYLDSRSYSTEHLKLKVVICTSEMSMRYERQKLARIFGCPVIDEYGCSETDIIAVECPHGSLHIMAENILVEVLRENQSELDVGELVITDLNNRLMPLIRYRLGDMGALEQGQCACGRGLPMLKSVAGRSQGQFVRTLDGSLIHSMTFAYFFERLVEEGLPVRHFRIVQEDIHKVTVLIVLENDNNQTRYQLDRRLQTELAPILGDEIECQTQYVDKIDLEPTHQKFSYFESHLTNHPDEPK